MMKHGVQLTVNDPEVQHALSVKYSHRTWKVQELSPDRWALYDDAYQLIAIGPWDSITSLYDPRKRESPPVLKGTTPDVQLDLGDLGL